MAQTTPNPASAYRPEMDGRAHEKTYDAFTHFTTVASVFVTCIVVGLAVGGVKHAWISAAFMILLAHIATAIGLFSTSISWRAPGAVLAVLLLMLLLY
ncbi:aa3-type cytochrome c oxidase subunit IV [uncultured Enterovirga sp.]|uniref:aa3-type cytochrome c oxidase subunit IV n=1 Tax=uncultured Enterovirga sp. TaxID=2026352 RepID=UPI0035C9DD1A